MCPYWNKIQSHSSQKSYNSQRTTSWSSKIHMYTTVIEMFIYLTGPLLFWVLGKKKKEREGVGGKDCQRLES